MILPQVSQAVNGLPERYNQGNAGLGFLDMALGIGYYVTLISVVLFAMTLFEAISRRIRNGKEQVDAHDRPDANP